jgi:hypothetical protein
MDSDEIRAKAKKNECLSQHSAKTNRFSRFLPLAFLSPKIIERIVTGRQPDELTARNLIRIEELPLSWAEQEAMLTV